MSSQRYKKVLGLIEIFAVSIVAVCALAALFYLWMWSA